MILPAVLAMGMVGATATAAVAGDWDNNSRYNPQRLQFTSWCEFFLPKVSWSVQVPLNAQVLDGRWYNLRTNPNMTGGGYDFDLPPMTPGTTANGAFAAAPARNGDRIQVIIRFVLNSGGIVKGQNRDTLIGC